jgi:aspartyl-tRNA(Asn)/glutamyl-tRNA(Gln) amidotransferase subunit A
MAELGNDIFFSTIGELHALLAARKISAVELARAFTQRLERLGPTYNALALSLRKEALRQAADVDKDIKRGRLRGPLQGIPYAVKDLLSYAGHPTTWGAKPYAEQVFDYNATVINKLAGVGGVLTGKLAMVELAGGGGYGSPAASLTGPGLNPWNRTKWAGGSSSGSAAAVAAGLVSFAIGSETSGSIITPASFCGVTALRPTYGLVSRHGAMALSWTLDKLGPFARSAEDCGHVLQAIAGKDSQDPGSAGKSFYYTPQYARPLKELRLGFAPADFEGRSDPAVRPVFAAALEVLRSAGAQLVEVAWPQFPYNAVLSTILAGEEASIFEPLIASGQVDQLADAEQIAGLRASQDVLAKDYLKAMRVRRQIQEAFRSLFANVDALVCPGRNGTAAPADQPFSPPPGAAATPTPAAPAPPSGASGQGFTGIVQAGNLAGLPALVVPCGFSENLPLALQIMGGPFSENLLLSIGKDFQSRTDWHKRRPPEA